MAATRLRHIREAKEMPQWEAAEKAHISTGLFSMIERGRRRPSLDVARRLAEVLEVDLEDLFPGLQE
jgi:DNA-binding XRE family transcriptional regulator